LPFGHFSCPPLSTGSSERAADAHGPGRGEVSQDELRVNDRIRISPIRLIGEDGEQVGIISTDEARAIAAEAGLDLVEVAPNSRPPVCRIMDYGKFKYEQARKAREAKKKQHIIHVKEIKMRPKIEEHDFGFKLRHARRFLEDGDKVKFTLRFRGREMTHPELGVRVLERVKGELVELGNVESDIRREGRTMTMLIGPRESQKG
jgi:translation initiation factor IF-3